jgi:hypothetical protein
MRDKYWRASLLEPQCNGRSTVNNDVKQHVWTTVQHAVTERMYMCVGGPASHSPSGSVPRTLPDRSTNPTTQFEKRANSNKYKIRLTQRSEPRKSKTNYGVAYAVCFAPAPPQQAPTPGTPTVGRQAPYSACAGRARAQAVGMALGPTARLLPHGKRPRPGRQPEGSMRLHGPRPDATYAAY